MNTPPPLPAASIQSPANQRPSARAVRVSGWLLVVLGLGLSTGMAFIANYLRGTIAYDSQPGSRSHWHGGPEFTRTTFELFGAVFFFGIIALSAGIYQIRTGSRSRVLIVLLFLAAAIMAYLGYNIVSTPSTSA